jgi:hypothetical protein
MRFEALAIIVLANLQSVQATELSSFQRTCSDIGFSEGTVAHGECVLELLDRQSVRSEPTGPEIQRGMQNTIEMSDQSRSTLIDIIEQQSSISVESPPSDSSETAYKPQNQTQDLDRLENVLRALHSMSGTTPQPPNLQGPSSTRRLERQEVRGNTRICYYRFNGYLKPLILNVSEFCPVNM